MKKFIIKSLITFIFLNSSLVIGYAQSWNELMDSTKFYQGKQSFQIALKWAIKAEMQANKEFGEKDTNYITSLNTIYLCYYYIGNLEKSLEFCEKAKSLINVVRGEESPEYAMAVNDLGVFYHTIGRYAKAEPLYKEALEIRRRIFKDDHTDLAESIINTAYLYNDRGDYKKAEPLFKEALEIYKRIYKDDHPYLANSMSSMAHFYESIGDYKCAEPLYKKALEMDRRLYKSNHPNLAFSISNMAAFYYDRGDYKQAEPLLKEALEMYRRIYREYHNDLAMSINNMGTMLYAKGDYKLAEPFLKESLEMCRCIFKRDHPYLAASINNMANFYQAIGDNIQAEPLFKEALSIYINILDNYFPSLSESEKKLFWNTISSRFEGFNSFCVQRSSVNPLIICDMYDMQLYSKALLFNSTSKIKNRIINSNDLDLNKKYKDFIDKKELLVKLFTLTDDARKEKGFNTDSIEKITNEIEKELSLKSELYAQSYEKKKITWKTIQAVLKPDEAAVEVVRFRFRDKKRFTDTVYYAFLIVTDQTEEHPDIVILENGKELENNYYNDYRIKIKGRIEDKLSFDRYWKKLQDNVSGYKKIYFSADGIYNKLNPATLLMPNGKYLLEEKDIQQVNSTKDILISYYKSQLESNIYNFAVLIGNPNFSLSDSIVRESSLKIRSQTKEGEKYNEEENNKPITRTRGIELTRLPETEKEIKNIEKFLKERNWVVNCYLGNMALKTAVKSVINPRILHIATHGMFLEDVDLDNKETFGFETKKMVDNPLLRSGLFFTGADNYLKSNLANPTGEENGLLTAYEAMNLDLDKTELVVLSACETGLGEIKNGEGVFGLRRAFQQAGAKAVIMSLWKVNDESTQKLMSSFYGKWVTGMTKRKAFSEAQQEVRKQFPEPYYWGAFVMVGE